MIKTMIRVILTILLLAFALPLPAGDVKTSASAPAAATAGSKAHHQPLHHQVHHEVHHNTTPVTRPRPIVSDPCPPVTTIDRYNSDLYLFGPRIRPFAPTRHVYRNNVTFISGSSYRLSDYRTGYTYVQDCDPIPIRDYVVYEAPVYRPVSYNPPRPAHVIADQPPWCDPIRVQVWAERETYRPGDDVRLYVRTDEDSYIYVYSMDPQGMTYQLLPNYHDRDNLVRANRVKHLPSDLYGLRASGSGWDTIRVVAVNSRDGQWRPPGATLGYSEQEPFAPFPRGYDSARDALRDSLQRDGGVIVTPPDSPGEQPCWGEAYTQLYVSNSTTDTPPPYNPPDYLPDPPSRNKYGSINLTSSPSRCDVYINDRFRGVTPLKVDLAPGQYDIMVVKSGYEPWRKFTTVLEREKERYSVRLERSSLR